MPRGSNGEGRAAARPISDPVWAERLRSILVWRQRRGALQVGIPTLGLMAYGTDRGDCIEHLRASIEAEINSTSPGTRRHERLSAVHMRRPARAKPRMERVLLGRASKP